MRTKNFDSCYNAFMPTVFNENGYKFFFFSNEENPLETCHIHVRKNGALAKFWITDKCSLAENFGFTAKELNEAWNGFFFE